MVSKILQQLDSDCTELCKKNNPSILRQKGFEDMVNLDWNKVLQEMSSRCPVLFEVMKTVVKKQNLQNHVAPLCMCYGILFQKRNHELSLIQRVNTILLAEGNAKKQVNKCKSYHLKHHIRQNN